MGVFARGARGAEEKNVGSSLVVASFNKKGPEAPLAVAVAVLYRLSLDLHLAHNTQNPRKSGNRR
jgi:hypothetical protein